MKTTGKLITTVSAKGQVVLPKAVLRRRHWSAGTLLVVEDRPDGVLLKSESAFAVTSPGDVFRSLAFKGKAKTLDQMETAIVAEATRRHARLERTSRLQGGNFSGHLSPKPTPRRR